MNLINYIKFSGRSIAKAKLERGLNHQGQKGGKRHSRVI